LPRYRYDQLMCGLSGYFSVCIWKAMSWSKEYQHWEHLQKSYPFYFLLLVYHYRSMKSILHSILHYRRKGIKGCKTLPIGSWSSLNLAELPS
jgi:hypothetical protein